ncbi:hypothetical protein NX02_16580 [Sphingomonas sanxanigenens DSM 19645 = NX02]|uniref:Uncharacterized protein n=2 Tax=Sphingomonas sanxanigenens TaxID=397260 RepID=W0AH98_9SPHN|nr:hypothetical protein NX02_16580 [Sphingomonas sanxanigenens DSM 19645 = NX02]
MPVERPIAAGGRSRYRAPMRTRSTVLGAETRQLLRLAWPVVLTSLNWTILHVTDIIVVGAVSTHEAAALGASRTLTYISIVSGLAWMSGVLVFASRSDGARDLPATGDALRGGIAMGLGLGIAAMTVLLLAAESLLLLIGVEPALVPDAARVVRVMAIAYPGQFILVAASYFLEGVSRPRRVMVVNLAMLPANAVAAWALAGGHLGMPALGAVGAGIATSAASFGGGIFMLLACWTLPDADARGVRDRGRAALARGRALVPRLIGFGLVPAIASALELAGFSFLIALSTRLGEVSAHAFQIVFSLHNVTFALALGLGSAAGVRVGNAVGEGQPQAAAPRALIAAAMTFAGTALLAILLGFAATPVVMLFPGTDAVHLLAAALLAIWAPFILFDGVQVVFVYALRSFGDQVASGVNSILAFFVITGGLGWLLVDRGLGAPALVWASGGGMMVAALLQGGRFWWVAGRRAASANN